MDAENQPDRRAGDQRNGKRHPCDAAARHAGSAQRRGDGGARRHSHDSARQRDDVKLRFGNPNPGEDPSQQTEDLGSDPLAATELGLKNLDRVAGYLIKATCKPGEDYDLLTNMYEQLLNQRTRELNHVASLVGGFIRDNVWFGEGEKQYEAVSPERQKKAVGFLMARQSVGAVEAFNALRQAARSSRTKIGLVAEHVLENGALPA